MVRKYIDVLQASQFTWDTNKLLNSSDFQRIALYQIPRQQKLRVLSAKHLIIPTGYSDGVRPRAFNWRIRLIGADNQEDNKEMILKCNTRQFFDGNALYTEEQRPFLAASDLTIREDSKLLIEAMANGACCTDDASGTRQQTQIFVEITKL